MIPRAVSTRRLSRFLPSRPDAGPVSQLPAGVYAESRQPPEDPFSDPMTGSGYASRSRSSTSSSSFNEFPHDNAHLHRPTSTFSLANKRPPPPPPQKAPSSTRLFQAHNSPPPPLSQRPSPSSLLTPLSLPTRFSPSTSSSSSSSSAQSPSSSQPLSMQSSATSITVSLRHKRPLLHRLRLRGAV